MKCADLNTWATYCHDAAFNAGWWDAAETPAERIMLYAVKIALIHSEISEALEGIRKATDDAHLPHRLSVEVELADALIRIFDLAGAMGLDLDGAVEEKVLYNQVRADHKKENREKENGKKF